LGWEWSAVAGDWPVRNGSRQGAQSNVEGSVLLHVTETLSAEQRRICAL